MNPADNLVAERQKLIGIKKDFADAEKIFKIAEHKVRKAEEDYTRAETKFDEYYELHR